MAKLVAQPLISAITPADETVACGVSLARPFSMRRFGPARVSAAGPGCAQPLLHPDRCTMLEVPAHDLMARATSGASWRVGSSAEAQAGAPAQATTCRRRW